MFRLCVLVAILAAAGNQHRVPAEDGVGWSTESPRSELLPECTRTCDETGRTLLTLAAGTREGLNGWWTTRIPVSGGQWYRFQAERQCHGIPADECRRAAVARLIWLDADGRQVLRNDPAESSYRQGERPVAEPEFPADGDETNGWTPVHGLYLAPTDATQVKMELCFRWGPAGSSITWRAPGVTHESPPPPRRVTLAAVHLQPQTGTSNAEKCAQFEPVIREAAAAGADLIVLPETLTVYNSGRSYADCAESIPGPSTDFFGQLAKELDTYLVVGLLEREQHLIYNVAVLIGPAGNVEGRYRKVTLPRGEIEGGVTPGSDYPVFETRFGRLGMMICYDGFFPEVARELSNNGAEIIAWPVWGCNPLLGAARACENHVYVVSSTYTDASANWMITGIYGRDGRVLAQEQEWGSFALSSVDVGTPLYWHSLGDFRAQIQRHRPVVGPH